MFSTWDDQAIPPYRTIPGMSEEFPFNVFSNLNTEKRHLLKQTKTVVLFFKKNVEIYLTSRITKFVVLELFRYQWIAIFM